MKDKIKTLSELCRLTKKLKRQGKSIGLITGCFDILHFGHIQLFRFAKRHVNILIIGIDNDRTINLSKGKRRPIFPQGIRAKMLAEQESVDFIFIIKSVHNFASHRADKIYEKILKEVKPSHLFTRIKTDKYWQNKKKRARKLGIRFVSLKKEIIRASSSKIIQKLERES